MFIKVFHTVALKQNTKSVENILVSSLVAGYIIIEMSKIIPISLGTVFDSVILGMVCILTGYLSGKFYCGKYMQVLFDFLKIRDTVNEFMWDDITDNVYPYKVVLTFGSIEYEGFCQYFESYSNSPHIVLSRYVKRVDKITVDDYSNNPEEQIILDSSKADSTRIIYDKRSEKCNDVVDQKYGEDFNKNLNANNEDCLS